MEDEDQDEDRLDEERDEKVYSPPPKESQDNGQEEYEGRLPYLRYQISRQGARIYCDSTEQSNRINNA